MSSGSILCWNVSLRVQSTSSLISLQSAFQPSSDSTAAMTPAVGPDVDLDTFLDSHYSMMIYKAIDEAAEVGR